MKILYIEDDEKLAPLVCILLRSHGYEVEHFALGKPGLERFGQDSSSWTAAIVDLDLPDVSGRTLIADMAAQRPDLPIVVHSGQSGPRFGMENRFELYTQGAAAFVWKPSGGKHLLEVLKGFTKMPTAPTE